MSSESDLAEQVPALHKRIAELEGALERIQIEFTEKKIDPHVGVVKVEHPVAVIAREALAGTGVASDGGEDGESDASEQGTCASRGHPREGNDPCPCGMLPL